MVDEKILNKKASDDSDINEFKVIVEDIRGLIFGFL